MFMRMPTPFSGLGYATACCDRCAKGLSCESGTSGLGGCGCNRGTAGLGRPPGPHARRGPRPPGPWRRGGGTTFVYGGSYDPVRAMDELDVLVVDAKVDPRTLAQRIWELRKAIGNDPSLLARLERVERLLGVGATSPKLAGMSGLGEWPADGVFDPVDRLAVTIQRALCRPRSFCCPGGMKPQRVAVMRSCQTVPVNGGPPIPFPPPPIPFPPGGDPWPPSGDPWPPTGDSWPRVDPRQRPAGDAFPRWSVQRQWDKLVNIPVGDGVARVVPQVPKTALAAQFPYKVIPLPSGVASGAAVIGGGAGAGVAYGQPMTYPVGAAARGYPIPSSGGWVVPGAGPAVSTGGGYVSSPARNVQQHRMPTAAGGRGVVYGGGVVPGGTAVMAGLGGLRGLGSSPVDQALNAIRSARAELRNGKGWVR